MKLLLLHEDASLTLYKGVSEYGGLENWPTIQVGQVGQVVPGFLSTRWIGRVYSEPQLTGPADSAGMLAEFKVAHNLVEDRTEEYIKWCDENNNPSHDVSMSYPQEWREDQSIWTVCGSGSAHGGVSCFNNASFVYCGVSLPYTVIAYYRNQEEWEAGS